MTSAVKGSRMDPFSCPAYRVNGTKSYCANERGSIHKVGKVYLTLQEVYSYHGNLKTLKTRMLSRILAK